MKHVIIESAIMLIIIYISYLFSLFRTELNDLQKMQNNLNILYNYIGLNSPIKSFVFLINKKNGLQIFRFT